MLKNLKVACVVSLALMSAVAPAVAGGAFSVGTDEDGTIYSFSSVGGSKAKSERLAGQACQNSEDTTSCKMVMSWDDGCGFIAIGHDDNNNWAWGTSNTRRGAQAQCEADGASCDWGNIIGDCSN